jgi:diadenylate cyclase
MEAFRQFALTYLIPALDFLIVWWVIYRVLLAARGTRAWPVFIAIALLAVAYFLSQLAEMRTVAWLLSLLIPLGPVAIVILLYPELRHFLEEIGRLGLWGSRLSALGEDRLTQLISAISKAMANLSERRVGALVALEREVRTEEYIATGTRVDAALSPELLESIFHTTSPLHDGGVIIRGLRIVAAGCLFPFSETTSSRQGAAHTRHRAALGMAQHTDAVVIVVSEETGSISLAHDGLLTRGLNVDGLRERLYAILAPPSAPATEKKLTERLKQRLNDTVLGSKPGL